MADTDPSALTALTGAGVAANDSLLMYDLSANIIKKMTPAECMIALLALMATGSITSTHILDGTIVNADLSASAAVALSKLATIADQTILGNVAGSTAVPIALTTTQVKTALALVAANISDFDTQVATTAVLKSLFDANTILFATTDNTPVALTVGASTFVGRKASGAISAMSATESRTNLGLVHVVSIQVSDPAGSAITTGEGKAFFRIPSTLNGLKLTGVAAAVTTVSSSGAPAVGIRNVTQTLEMLTTNVTIDANETDSATAATPVAINGSNNTVATADMLAIDIDTAGTGTKGLIIELQFAE